jgi:hypothetical protein
LAQQQRAVAIGLGAGLQSQGLRAIAIGQDAGVQSQGENALAIGYQAGFSSQGTNSIAIGNQACLYNQGVFSVAIGFQCGSYNQNAGSIALGVAAGHNSQGNQSIAIGYYAGLQSQKANSIAIGYQAGNRNQNLHALAIGSNAGSTNQNQEAIAIGLSAGQNTQGTNAIAIGTSAGQNTQGTNAIAIGYQAGINSQGTNSIAIGNQAGMTNQAENSIALNASGSAFSPATSGFYAAPIRNITQTTVLCYDTTNKEITYYTPYYFGAAPVAFKATSGGADVSVSGGFGMTKFSNNLTNVSGGSRGSFQVGSSYNTSTGNFTAPYDGLYYFHASVLWDTEAYAGNYCSVMISLSTHSLADHALMISQVGENETFNKNFTQNCAGVVKLDAGQEVCVFTNGNTTASRILKKFCVFGGYLIQRL